MISILIKEVYDIDLKNSREEQAIFIPHFRDESVYNKNVVEDDGFTEKLTEIEAILSSKI